MTSHYTVAIRDAERPNLRRRTTSSKPLPGPFYVAAYKFMRQLVTGHGLWKSAYVGETVVYFFLVDIEVAWSSNMNINAAFSPAPSFRLRWLLNHHQTTACISYHTCPFPEQSLWKCESASVDTLYK